MNHNNREVYSSTGFVDLLASPSFYALSVIAFVLGFSSIFGFLQAPEKLKNTVDLITKKVVLQSNSKATELVSVLTVSSNQDMTNKHNGRNTATLLGGRYSIFMDKLIKKDEDREAKGPIQTIQLASFDYDITSKHFWGDLDMNNPHATVHEDSMLNNSDSLIIGVPMTLESLPVTGDEKYSLKLNRNYL